MNEVEANIVIEGDRDFEPSAGLLIQEYDDEGTMEEEENLSSESGDNEELDDLQKVTIILLIITIIYKVIIIISDLDVESRIA